MSPSDVTVKTVEEAASEIGDQAFRIPSAPYPERNIWWKIDYIEDGKIILKQAERQT